MSLVIAIKDKDRIVLGSDKQVSTGMTKDHTCTKIWKVSELPGAIMGGVGSARASQIIQYSQILDKNELPEELTTEYIVTVVAPTIAATLKANGIAVEPSKEDDCVMTPNAFIFAYKEQAWIIWNDLSVIEMEDYFAIGSGSDVAKGVLFATEDRNPFERIVTCIDAAADTTLFVDDGLDLLVTEQLENDVVQIAEALDLEIMTEEELLKETKKEMTKQSKEKEKTKSKKTKTKVEKTESEK